MESPPLKGIALFLKILRDWFPVLLTKSLRPVVISEIEKVLDCKNPKNGTMYACDRCKQLRWVPFTCKSRFCPSCGNLSYQIIQSLNRELKAQGYITISGKCPIAYFRKKFYGLEC